MIEKDSKKKSIQTPLSEINSYDVSRIHMDIHLPNWINPEEIAVESQRLVGLLTVAGIKMLDVKTKAGETSKARPMIMGMNQQGGAYGGGIKSETIRPYDSISDYSELTGFSQPHHARWLPALRVGMNTSEITQRLQDKRADLRSPETWANEIDLAIKNSVREAGTKHLLSLNGNDLFNYGLWIAINSNTPKLVTHLLDIQHKLIDASQDASLLLNSLWISGTLLSGVYLLLNKKFSKRPYPMRFSTIPYGPELDNALVLQFLARKKYVHALLAEGKE